MQTPTDVHWIAVKRILRYLKHSQGDGLKIDRPSFTLLSVFSDAYWADYLDYRQSTGGFRVFFGSNLVAWSAQN